MRVSLYEGCLDGELFEVGYPIGLCRIQSVKYSIATG